MARRNSAGSKRSRKTTGGKRGIASGGSRQQSLVGRVARSIRTRIKHLVS